MDIRVIRRSGDARDLRKTTLFCVDNRCHVLVSVGARLASDIPEDANVLKYIEGTSSLWSVGPCDGACRITSSLPQPVMDDVAAFLTDGKLREGETAGNVLKNVI